jgi:DNA-binding CsgD family transcriptional regulator
MLEDRLHQVIGDIYEAALLAEFPPHVLEKMAELTGSARGIFAIAAFSEPTQLHWESGVFLGIDPIFHDKANEFAHENLWMQRRKAVLPGSAGLGQMLAKPEELRKTAFYNELCLPAGTAHVLALNIFDDPTRNSHIGLFRPLEMEPHAEQELRIGHVLASHLRRAFQVGVKVRTAALHAGSFELAFDRLTVGCMLIDASGRLLFANAKAIAGLDGNSPLQVRRGVVRPRFASDRGSWHAFLARLTGGNGTPEGGAITLGQGSRHILGVRGVPLAPHKAEIWGVSPLPHQLGLVILSDVATEPRSLTQAVQSAYGLTPAEAELAAALVNGESVADYAERRRRSLNTVRTHLKAIFAKTGSSRQSELVRTLIALGLLREPQPAGNQLQNLHT